MATTENLGLLRLPPTVRRDPNRKYRTEEERKDWDAIDRWTREVEIHLKALWSSVKELQDIQNG
jgi:TPP-dependent pyruvate/acetoin dehydrogenase alpha subunit